MLPLQYAWLAQEKGPKMLVEGLKTYGTVEAPGPSNSPTILAWAREVGLGKVYTADATPWCGLWMTLIAKRAGKPLPTKSGLWALNWASHWGSDGGQPELGDVLVFTRAGGGHVGLYIGEDRVAYHVLGGNQNDAVTIARVEKARLRGCRQYFATGKPANVRPIILGSDGALSSDER